MICRDSHRRIRNSFRIRPNSSDLMTVRPLCDSFATSGTSSNGKLNREADLLARIRDAISASVTRDWLALAGRILLSRRKTGSFGMKNALLSPCVRLRVQRSIIIDIVR